MLTHKSRGLLKAIFMYILCEISCETTFHIFEVADIDMLGNLFVVRKIVTSYFCNESNLNVLLLEINKLSRNVSRVYAVNFATYFRDYFCD